MNAHRAPRMNSELLDSRVMIGGRAVTALLSAGVLAFYGMEYNSQPERTEETSVAVGEASNSSTDTLSRDLHTIQIPTTEALEPTPTFDLRTLISATPDRSSSSTVPTSESALATAEPMTQQEQLVDVPEILPAQPTRMEIYLSSGERLTDWGVVAEDYDYKIVPGEITLNPLLSQTEIGWIYSSGQPGTITNPEDPASVAALQNLGIYSAHSATNPSPGGELSGQKMTPENLANGSVQVTYTDKGVFFSEQKSSLRAGKYDGEFENLIQSYALEEDPAKTSVFVTCDLGNPYNNVTLYQQVYAIPIESIDVATFDPWLAYQEFKSQQ